MRATSHHCNTIRASGNLRASGCKITGAPTKSSFSSTCSHTKEWLEIVLKQEAQKRECDKFAAAHAWLSGASCARPTTSTGFRASTTCIGVNQPCCPPSTKLSAPSLNIALVATLLGGATPTASKSTNKLWLPM